MSKIDSNAFLALVKEGLWEQTGDNFDVNHLCEQKDYGWANYKVDWEKVYQLAEEQSVVGLVTAGIERLMGHDSQFAVPQEVLLQMIGEVQMMEQTNKGMNHFIAKLVGDMRQTGIYTLLVKGQGVAQSYERPLWRACGDVDLFLSEDNYEKAKELLLPIAETVEPEWLTSMHLGMTIDGWVVELHGSLRGSLSPKINSVLNEIRHETFYEGKVRSWVNNGIHIFLLDVNNEIIYVFNHFLNHFYKGGIGLRQICDWCRLLWTYRESLNSGLLKSRLRKMGLMTEWKAFGAFVVEYLGMPPEAMPLYSPEVKWKRKADKLCKFILEVGNFGHNRDMSYYEKYPYLIRKTISLGRRCGDIIKHMRIFPLESIRFFPYIMYNGIRSAVRGE